MQEWVPEKKMIWLKEKHQVWEEKKIEITKIEKVKVCIVIVGDNLFNYKHIIFCVLILKRTLLDQNEQFSQIIANRFGRMRKSKCGKMNGNRIR